MKLRRYTDRGRCKPAVQQPNHTVQALLNCTVLSDLFLVHGFDCHHLLNYLLSSWHDIGSYLDHLVWCKAWLLSPGTYWHLNQLCRLSACKFERECSTMHWKWKYNSVCNFNFSKGLSSHFYLKCNVSARSSNEAIWTSFSYAESALPAPSGAAASAVLRALATQGSQICPFKEPSKIHYSVTIVLSIFELYFD